MFHVLSDRNAHSVIRDCQQCNAALAETFMEAMDILRTRESSSPVWSGSPRSVIRDALFQLMDACDELNDADSTTRHIAVVPKPQPAPPAPEPAIPKPRVRARLGDMFDDDDGGVAPHNRLGQSMAKLMAAIAGLDELGQRPLKNASEALYLFHHGILAHMESSARTWALNAVTLGQHRWIATRSTAGTATPEKHVFFQPAFVAEAMRYHWPFGPEFLADDNVERRPPNMPWSARPSARDEAMADAERFVSACFFAETLSSPLPSWSKTQGDGYIMDLAQVIDATGLMPTVMVAVAMGAVPWITTTRHRADAATWREREEAMPPLDDNGSGRRSPIFWRQLMDAHRNPADAAVAVVMAPRPSVTSPLLIPAKIIAQFKQARLLPRDDGLKLELATPANGTALRDVDARVERLAASLLASSSSSTSTIRSYLESLMPSAGSSSSSSLVLANLLRIYIQLPLAQELILQRNGARNDGDDDDLTELDSRALRHIMGVLLVYETLIATLRLLASPGGLEILRDKEADVDVENFHVIVERFITLGRRRLPPYLVDAMATIGDILDCGGPGLVQWHLDRTGVAASLPLLRNETVDLHLLAIRARLSAIRSLFTAYLRDWRTTIGKTGFRSMGAHMWRGTHVIMDIFKAMATGQTPLSTFDISEEEARRLVPSWFRFGVAGSILASLDGLCVGAGLFAAVPVACGLYLPPSELASFCALHASRGGISARAVKALVRLTSHEANPNRSLGVPLLAHSTVADAQYSLWRYLKRHNASRLVAAMRQLRGVPAILIQWVLAVAAVKDDDIPSLLAALVGCANGSEMSVFLNAPTLKYGLRTVLQCMEL